MSGYILYARKSTESEDRQVLSIDSQIHELRAIAQRRGLRIAEILSESHSAKAPGRPVFGTLMRRVAKGQVGGILCWKMDRLARNHLDTGLILQALADGKLHEVVTSDRTYTRDGNDRFMGNFELGMATKFIDDLRANVKRGNRAKLQRGWINHNPPLGYLLDPTSKTIVKDPERYAFVRRMWEMLLSASYRPEQIRQTANEQWNFRTRQYKRIGGTPLSRATLYGMFGNPFYMGLIRLRSGESFVGAHPPMISRQEYDRAQEILGRCGRPRPKEHEFSFTGLIRCGVCGGAVTAEEHVKPSGRRYVYYRCSRRKAGVVCRDRPVSEAELVAQFLPALSRIAVPEPILAWIRKRVAGSFAADTERKKAATAAVESELATLGRERENLLSLRLRDLVDDGTFARERQRIDEERARIETRRGSNRPSCEEVAQATISAFSFAATAAERFQNGTRVQQRMILEAVGLNFELKAKKLLYKLKNPFQFIAGAGDRPHWSTCLDDVRTWIEESGEYCALPDLDMEERITMVPEYESVSEGGGRSERSYLKHSDKEHTTE